MAFIIPHKIESLNTLTTTEIKITFDLGRIFNCEMVFTGDEIDLHTRTTRDEFECILHELMLDYLEKEVKEERKKVNRFKAIAEMLGVEYMKRFKTDGYGEHRIDHNGVYSYEDKSYDTNALVMLLTGAMTPIKEELCDTK